MTGVRGMMVNHTNAEDKTKNRLAQIGETRESIRRAAREAKKAQKGQQEEKPPYNPFFNYHKRRFPIWKRLILLIGLCVFALVAGAMFGYGALGHGNPFAVFNPVTWRHILDFFKTN